MEKDTNQNAQKKSQKLIHQHDSFDSHPMLLSSRKGSKLQNSQDIIYDVIIIGAGISGMLAAQILLKQQKTVLVLQAQSSYGGSIKQQNIGEKINIQSQPQWIKNNELVLNAQIDIGTSQISSDHTWMIKLVQQYDLTLSPLYSDGKFIYGESQESIKTMMSLMDIYFCPQYKKIISKLLAKIQNISKNILQAHNKTSNNPGKNHYRQVLRQYIQKFDKMTVREFFQRQLQNQNLRNMVINQFEIVESIQVDKISMFHVFLHGYGLQNLKLFTQMKSYLKQNLRIKQGNMELVKCIKQKIQKRQKKLALTQVLKFNQKVLQIKNEINKQVQVITNKRSYKCFKIFFSATMESANKVNISKLSPTKRLVLDNQQQGNLQRAFLVFETAFWRSKYSGRGMFSQKFPISQMMDFSPSNLSCGILCLVICGSKIQKWKQMFRVFQDQAEQKIQVKNYLTSLVAKIFLNGDTTNQHLKKMEVILADSNNYGYQTFTKIGVANSLQQLGQDYLDCYTRDEHNIIFLGSQLSKKFGSYMEGAVRHTREQIYRYLEIDDPWGKL